MNIAFKDIIENFVEVLIKLSQLNSENFSGVGMVLYSDARILSKYHCDLVSDVGSMPALKLDTSNIIHYLATIADYQHPYHDGFHFVNAQGVLTHVAQFFSPPVYNFVPKMLSQGARTFCSQCGSNIQGVLIIGSVSSNRNIHLFQNGVLVNEKFNVNDKSYRPLARLERVKCK